MTALIHIALFLLTACLSLDGFAQTLRIVTEPWAPYVMQESGQMRGLDYEATVQVMQRLGVKVEWSLAPWKRALAMMQKGEADAVLDVFRDGERDEILIYPSEPLSRVQLVLFQANARPHEINRLEDLHGLTVGTSPGYLYSPEFDTSPLFERETAPTHEANFGKLLLGRVDLVITDRIVGQRLLDDLKLRDRISQLPLVINRRDQFLGFRRQAGLDTLAQRFGSELERFKREPAYARLMARYIGDVR